MRAQRGSVSVEFAAVLPLVAICLLLVAQIGLFVSQQLTVQHAAREGARVAAVTNDAAQARDAAIAAGHLDASYATVAVTPDQRTVGTPVTVTVTYPATRMPLIGIFVPFSYTITARATMRTEKAAP